MFDALRNRNYRLYWSSTLASFFGGQMQMPAQQWLAYEITQSPLKLTLVMAMQAIPMLLFSLYSGVIIDRVQKRNVLITTQSFNVLVNITVATLITLGEIQYWHLLVASGLNGLNAAFNMPARNAVLAEMVPRDKIYNAIALNNGGANVAQIAGPALSGAIIGFVNIQGAYFVGIAFNVASIIIVSFLPPTRTVSNITRSVRSDVVQGLRYLRVHQILIILLVMELALTLFGMTYQGLMPVFATQFNLGPQGFGLMLSAVGVGSLMGSLVIASLGNFKHKGLALLGTGVVFGVVLVLFANSKWLSGILGVEPGVFYLAALWLIIIGVSSNAYTSTSNALIQLHASDEFRGRMNSMYGMIIGVYPLSTLGAGAVAETLGASLAMTISGTILTLFMIMMAVFSQRIRRVE